MIRSNSNVQQPYAKIIGALFLLAIIAYALGDHFLAAAVVSRKSTPAGIGAVLMAMNSIIVVSIGVLLSGMVARRSPLVASSYLSARIIEAILLATGIVWLLLGSDAGISTQLATKGQFYTYQLAMIALGVGSIPFFYTTLITRLIPPALSWWGIIGYAIFAFGAILELLGFNIGLILSIPARLFEVAFALWLIVKGFNLPQDRLIKEA